MADSAIGKVRAWSSSGDRTRAGVYSGLLWGGLALILYVATCSPGAEWQDSGVHQYRILTGLLQHPRGLALSHPLHYWCGQVFRWLPLPLGELAYRLNLMSSLFGAVGVGLLAAIIVRLTHSRLAASLAAVVLLFAHSYWQMSVLTETYTLAAALMTLEWCLLLRYTRTHGPWLLVALFAVNGLHVADHLLGLLTLATYLVLVLERVWHRRLSVAWLPLLSMAWFITTAPYWALILSYYGQTGDLMATVSSAFFGGGGQYKGWAGEVLSLGFSSQQFVLAAMTLGYNFPALAVPLAILGIFRPARKRGHIFRRVLLGQTIIICVFVMRYTIVDLYTYFVPVCVLVALWFGLGVDRLITGLRDRRPRSWLIGALLLNALLPLGVYLYFPIVAKQHQWMHARLRDIVHRDSYAHFFRPWRCADNSAALFAHDALEYTGAGGWLLADGTTGPAIAYTYLVHGGPTNIRVYSERDCLSDPNLPHLSEAALATFIRAGGRVVVVPGGNAEQIWGRSFVFDQTDGDFWTILADQLPVFP